MLVSVSSATGSVHVRGWSARLGALVWDNTTALSPSASSEVSLRAAVVPWPGAGKSSPSKVSPKSEKSAFIITIRYILFSFSESSKFITHCDRRLVCGPAGEHSPVRCARRTQWTLSVRGRIPAECRHSALFQRCARPPPARDLRRRDSSNAARGPRRTRGLQWRSSNLTILFFISRVYHSCTLLLWWVFNKLEISYF